MSTVKSKKLQVGTDATSSNNFTIYQPSTPDGTLRIGVGNADNPTEVGRFTSAGYKPTTAPAFSAYKSASSQSITSAAFTKVTYDVEEFDINNNFASSRFTPTVAGYYQINALTYVQASNSLSRAITTIYKNGSSYKFGNDNITFSTTEGRAIASTLVYLNGTTDYIEIYILPLGTSPIVQTGQANTWVNGYLVQQA